MHVRARNTIGAAVRPIDANALSQRPAEQLENRHAVVLCLQVEQRVLDSGDGFARDAADSRAGGGVEVPVDRFGVARILAEDDGFQAFDGGGDSGRAEAFLKLAPADEARVAGQLEE